jgi:hypothetical protein
MMQNIAFQKLHDLCFKRNIIRTNGAGIAQSVQRLAEGWMVRESNPGGGDFFAPVQTRSEAHPAFLYNGYRVFSGGKAAGAWR